MVSYCNVKTLSKMSSANELFMGTDTALERVINREKQRRKKRIHVNKALHVSPKC